jgi:DNA-binding transcriptional regulator GbsR (MarR family)
MQNELNELRQQFIELAGNSSQSLGVGRVIGQIFAHLYFSREPQSLDDLTEALGISKGSASMSVRQLDQWGALKKVWKKGDRKDYYEARDEWGRIARRAMLESVSRHIEETEAVLDHAQELMAAAGKKGKDADWKFCQKRLKRFGQFRDRVQWVWEKVIQGVLVK